MTSQTKKWLIALGILILVALIAYLAVFHNGSGGGLLGSGAPARLSLSGSTILDPSGNPIVLRGYNWGYWQYTDPTQDALQNRNQGANMVRIPIRWWGQYGTASFDFDGQTVKGDSYDPAATSTGFINPNDLAFLDQQIQAASSAHLWIDLFVGSDCGKGTDIDSVQYCGTGDDGSHATFENDPEMMSRFVVMWQFLANRYKNTPYIGMYEIQSEPRLDCIPRTHSCDPSATTAFYSSVISPIHAIDPVTPFLIGPSPTYDINDIASVYIATTTPIIYTGDALFTSVEKAGGNVSQLLSNALAFRTAKSVPIFVQQVSANVTDADATTSAETLLGTLNKDNLGWAWWAYRDESPRTAPYTLSGSDWVVDSSWLNLISGYLGGNTTAPAPGPETFTPTPKSHKTGSTSTQ